MPEVATPNQAEREFETGSDEFHKGMSEVHSLNAKRTFDEYQDAALTSIRNNQRIFDQAAANLQVQLGQINSLTMQHMQNAVQVSHQVNQNAVETANMTGKQAVKHADIAADALWSPVEKGAGDNLAAGAVPANRATDVAAASTGVAAAGQAVNAEAVASAVAIAVNAALTPLIAQLASIANVISQVQPKTGN